MVAMRIKDVLQKTTRFFHEKGFTSPRLDAELLISSALKWERMRLYLNYDYPLSEEELLECRERVRRRSTGEPVAYILGRKDFYNHRFIVSPAVLIPRPETETLVEETLHWMKTRPAGSAEMILDFGAGSGCIGLSLLAGAPTARLVAIDLSPQAIEVARRNAQELGLEARAEFLTADLGAVPAQTIFDKTGDRADVIVANPPYIADDDPRVEPMVKRYEPMTALFANENGLGAIRAWAVRAAEVARSGAWVMFEIGSGQAAAAMDAFARTGEFDAIEIRRDLAGHDRFVRAMKK